MSLTTPHQAPPAGLGISTGFPMAPTWVFWRSITSSSLYFGVHLNWVESSPPFNYTQGTGALRRDLIKETVRPWWGTADREECWAHQSWVLVSALLLTWLCGLEPLASPGLSFFICNIGQYIWPLGLLWGLNGIMGSVDSVGLQRSGLLILSVNIHPQYILYIYKVKT